MKFTRYYNTESDLVSALNTLNDLRRKYCNNKQWFTIKRISSSDLEVIFSPSFDSNEATYVATSVP